MAANVAARSEVVVRVAGMTCGGCAQRIQTALEKTGGVDNAEVSYPEGLARITGADLEPAALAAQINALGYQASVASLTTDDSTSELPAVPSETGLR
ncbi:MAG: cation transporter, partial [Proteobacteria bacterium]|nr:cation transporter [Pseudomonadota bacterium]